MKYYLYKGLKKPLVFFGLKGKYIYWALGVLATDLILTAIVSTIGGLIGTLITLGIGGGAVYFIYQIQDKKGLYNKTKNHNEIYVYPIKFGVKILKNEKEL